MMTYSVSVGRTSGGLNVSGLSDSDAKREFIMMPPEEKLKYFESRAQTQEDNQEVGGLSYH